MKIERYYSSIREENTNLTDDAAELLDKEDYIGFFKACGPNYVRGIRRKQEVSATFKFETTSMETAKEFASSLEKLDGPTSSESAAEEYSSVTETMEIKITGFGLGLTEEGSSSLIATSLQEFEKVMMFAYQTMTSNKSAHHIGMIYGVELVPYAENPSFQVAAKIPDESVEIPLSLALVPKAYRIADKTDMVFVIDERDQFACRVGTHVIDKFGYCCETTQLYDYATAKYTVPVEDLQLDVLACRPIRAVERSVMKDNMSANGEFVARIDSTLRLKMNTLSTLERCISILSGYPSRLDKHLVQPHTDKFGINQAEKISVYEMKKALDPKGDYYLIRHLSQEIDEFVEMYYSPCLAAVFGSTKAKNAETDPSYMMAYPWYSHDECMHLSCFASTMRWDRDKGGCIAGILSGTEATSYEDTPDTSKCPIDPDSLGNDTLECKVKASELNQFVTEIKQCWGAPDTVMQGEYSIELFLNDYCMPTITGETLTDTEYNNLYDTLNDCATENFVVRRKLDANAQPKKRVYSAVEIHNQHKKKELEKRYGRRSR